MIQIFVVNHVENLNVSHLTLEKGIEKKRGEVGE